MRFFTIIGLALLASACAAPQQRVTRPVASPPPAPPVVQQTGSLIGLDAAALAVRFGSPDLRVVEGQGTKLQYRGPCVLDVYLYPSRGSSAETVVHVDARDPYGRDSDRETCITTLDGLRP